MKSTLVGFRRFTSKKGTPCCVANIVTEFSPADVSRGSCGSDCQSVFLPDNLLDYLTEKDIGKSVELFYSINAGRAYLQNLVVQR